jgi:exopolyphosphatase / guanosine-5'-triphosphate,3'-diphosphate pyrophosphatase
MAIGRILEPASTGPVPRMSAVRVAVVDVGANTVRLLVAGRAGAVREERVYVGLGEEIERAGRLSARKIDAAADAAGARVRRARKLGCAWIDVLVTSPGRQSSNGEELVEALREATDAPVRVLSAEEEGALAWRGAVAAAGDLPDTVAVCDVGGGSAQLAVGRRDGRPAWVRSVDVGSLRLTRRAFEDDPPDAVDVARAQAIVAESFSDIAPPIPLAGLAVGGTARGLRRVVGAELTQETLLEAVRRLAKRPSRRIAKDFGVDEERARTVTAGALILLEVQRRIGVPLQVGRGGLREGAALELLETAAEAASA